MLHVSYIAAVVRATGKLDLLEVNHALTGGTPQAALGALHEQFRTTEGEDLRRRYSQVNVVLDNVVVAHYEFPDPAVLERERKQKQLTEARTALAAATQREVAAIQAATDAKAAKDERKAATARVADLEHELGIGAKDDEPDEPEEYRALTVPQLREHCEALGIDVTGFRLRREFIEAIVADDKLSALTVGELRLQLEKLDVPIAGLKRKRQLIDALEKRVRDADDLGKLDDDKLHKVADELKIEFAPGASREQIEAAILKATA